jgi:hypothetical protein
MRSTSALLLVLAVAGVDAQRPLFTFVLESILAPFPCGANPPQSQVGRIVVILLIADSFPTVSLLFPILFGPSLHTILVPMLFGRFILVQGADAGEGVEKVRGVMHLEP